MSHKAPTKCRRLFLSTAITKNRKPAVARVGRPYCLYQKDSTRLLVAKESDFTEWVQSYTRYNNATISNATINARIQYEILTHMGDCCKQQLCDRTSAEKDMHAYYW